MLAHAARFAEARYHLERAAELGRNGSPAVFGAAIGHPFDPLGSNSAYLARCLLHAGHPDQHARVLAGALADAAAWGHGPGLAYVLFQAAEIGVEQRDPAAARARVDRLIPLAREQGYALWLAMAEAIEGWVMVEEGESAGAAPKIRRGLAAYEAQGVLMMQPFLLAMLGSVLGRAGRHEEAVQLLEAGIRLVDEKGEAIWAPELHSHGRTLATHQFTHTLHSGGGGTRRCRQA